MKQYSLYYISNDIFTQLQGETTVVSGKIYFGFRLNTQYNGLSGFRKACGLLNETELEAVLAKIKGSPSIIVVSQASVGCRMNVCEKCYATFRAKKTSTVDPNLGESFEVSFLISKDKGATDAAEDLAALTLQLGDGGQYVMIRSTFRVKGDKKLAPFPRYGRQGEVAPPKPIEEQETDITNMGGASEKK